MSRRRVITIGPERGRTGWWTATDSHGRACRQRRKADLVRLMRLICRDNQPSQLRVKARTGRLQFEHTYGADPWRWKG